VSVGPVVDDGLAPGGPGLFDKCRLLEIDAHGGLAADQHKGNVAWRLDFRFSARDLVVPREIGVVHQVDENRPYRKGFAELLWGGFDGSGSAGDAKLAGKAFFEVFFGVG